MTAFDNIKVNNWPATSNELEDFLVLELPLNDAAALTQSRRDILVSNTVLHSKTVFSNGNATSTDHGVSHAIVFRGASAPKKHLEDNTQTNGSFYSQSNHYVQSDTSTHHWDWTFNPPIPNVTNVKVNSRHLNQHFNPYYYQVYDENDNAQVATPADKTSVSTDTEIYAGSAINLKRIKMYGGAGGDDFFKIIVNGVTLNQNNGIGTVTEDDTHTASTTYATGIPKKHYDENCVLTASDSNYLVAENMEIVGSDDYTYECYAYADGTPGNWTLLHTNRNTVTGLLVLFTSATNVQLYFGAGSNWSSNTNITISNAASGWHHYAVVRQNGGDVSFYMDGVLQGTATPGTHKHGDLVIGRQNGDNNLYWNGAVQDVRVYKTAKYTSNFTPPGAILG